jgi:hypothetical protein
MVALTSVSAGTRVFTQARADKLLVGALAAKSRMPLTVEFETTEKAAVPELDHCDHPTGKLPKAVELKVSTIQGDADGAWRDSRSSRRGMTVARAFLFMGSLAFGQVA